MACLLVARPPLSGLRPRFSVHPLDPRLKLICVKVRMVRTGQHCNVF
jgi:hypothetical protein